MTEISSYSNTAFDKARDFAVRRALPLVCWALVFGLACGLTFRQMAFTWMLKEDRVRLERCLDGTVYKPFAYRVFVPLTIQLLDKVTPNSVVQAFLSCWKPIERKAFPEGIPADVNVMNYCFLAIIQVMSLLGYAFISHKLYLRLYGRSRYHWLIPVGVLTLLIPFVANGRGHLYDFSVLMFMAALLYAIATDRQSLYLMIFVISCLNKETTILATVAYGFYFVDRMPPRKFALMLIAQVGIFSVIYAFLRYHFSDNAGQGMECWFLLQMQWITGRTFPEYVCFLAVLVFLVFYRWSQKPLVLKRAIWMMVPHLGLCLVGAMGGEWRNLYESLPLLSMLILRNTSQIAVMAVE